MLFTWCSVVYFVVEMCNDDLQQALKAMAQCIAIGSAKVSRNGMTALITTNGLVLTCLPFVTSPVNKHNSRPSVLNTSKLYILYCMYADACM